MIALKRLYEIYLHQIQVKNPAKTKILTAFSLISLGDFITQVAIERPRLKREEPEKNWAWDKVRTLRMGATMGFVNNPVSQLYIHKVAPHIGVSSLQHFASAGKVAVVDNLVRTVAQMTLLYPISMCILLFGTVYLKNFKVQEGIDNIKLKFWAGMKAAVCFWPFWIFLTYQFVPLYFR